MQKGGLLKWSAPWWNSMVEHGAWWNHWWNRPSARSSSFTHWGHTGHTGRILVTQCALLWSDIRQHINMYVWWKHTKSSEFPNNQPFALLWLIKRCLIRDRCRNTLKYFYNWNQVDFHGTNFVAFSAFELEINIITCTVQVIDSNPKIQDSVLTNCYDHVRQSERRSWCGCWVWLTVGVGHCTSSTLCNLIHGSITSQSAHTDQTSDSGTNMHANVKMWPGMCKSLSYTKPSEHLLHKCVQTCHKHTVGHTIQSRVDQHEK